MNLREHKNFWAAVIIFIITFAALYFLIIILPGCNVTKHRNLSTSDTTGISKSLKNNLDTSKGGNIKSSDISSKENSEWWKKTFVFPTDTSKNVTNVYPSTIIYEGGKGNKETNERKFDSGWFYDYKASMEAKYDSTNKKISELQEDKKSKSGGIPWWVFVVVFLVYEILTKVVFKKFSIIKKII